MTESAIQTRPISITQMHGDRKCIGNPPNIRVRRVAYISK